MAYAYAYAKWELVLPVGLGQKEGAAGCDQLYRIIALPVPPSPGQTHTAGTPPPSVGGRRRSIIIPMRHRRALIATAGSVVHVDRSGVAIIAPHHKPLHRMVSYL